MRWLAAILGMTCVCTAVYGQQCPPAPSKLSMGKGEYVSQPGIVFTLENFVADMVPKGKTSPQCFIKTTQIDHGRVVVSADSLTRLFREKVENGGGDAKNASGSKDGAKDAKNAKDPKDAKDSTDSKDAKDSKDNNSVGQISDIAIKTSGNELDLSGRKKGKISIPFDLIGPVDLADPQTLRLHVETIKAAGIPAKSLLKLFGFHLSKMMHPGSTNGVIVRDDAILVNVEAIANVKGQMSHVAVSGKDLVVDFVPEKPEKQKPETKRAKSEQADKPAAAPRHIASATTARKK